ncbi:AraC family transcriptional regulator [Pseudonocardia zijingensis]|uniref:AraC family transcriptional regulator n=1 Tax=Pseudonocardia zijingensis TaxID=153376 RepID=A0ABP4ARH8_9PSEU
MDVLTDLLRRSRARGAAFSHSTARGDWGVEFPEAAQLAIHGILGGEAFAWTHERGEAQRVLAGDVVLIRGPAPHHMAASPAAGLEPFGCAPARTPPSGGAVRMRFGADEGQPTTFFCGAYRFEGELCAGLLAGLPPLTVVRPEPGSGLSATFGVLAGELLREGPGQQALLDSLLDVVLVQALREQLAADLDTAPGWFRAMADDGVAAALQAVHAAPHREWTVAALAAEASLSRATFARRFTRLLGLAPLAYVTDWRMALAREELRAGDASLAAVARSLGYASEFSFAAAFKRHHGVAPGRWRASARSA